MAGGAISADITKLPKPILRGFHNATIKRNLIVAGILMTAAGIACQFRNNRRIHDYAEFYKNYDAEKSFNRMAKAGLLQSVEADEVE